MHSITHVQLDSCVVTVFGFCPFESIIGTIAATIIGTIALSCVYFAVRSIVIGSDAFDEIKSIRDGDDTNESPLEKAVRINSDMISLAEDAIKFKEEFLRQTENKN